MYKLSFIAVVCFATVVSANDIRLGSVTPYSRKIYDEIKEANPALWKRTEEIVVSAIGNEVISAVAVTDLRDDKNGDASIVIGGIGTKSVTISLKSPTIFRGYKFRIEVYASDPNARFYNKGAQYTDEYSDTQYARKY